MVHPQARRSRRAWSSRRVISRRTRSGTSPCVEHHGGPDRAEIEGGFIGVVSSAPQLDVLRRRQATGGPRPDVMELHEPALGAAPPSPGHECASATVPLPGLAFHFRRDAARRRRDAAARPRPIGGRVLSPGNPFQQSVERAIKDLANVTTRNGVAQQFLRAAQFLDRCRARGKPHLIAIGGERSDGRMGRRCHGRRCSR